MDTHKRIMFAGDTHGNYSHWLYLLKQAADFEVDAIFQVGDYGFWEHTDSGRIFLLELQKTAKAYGLPIYWIDGNHENHVMLRENYGPGGKQHNLTSEGFWTIRDNIFYAPRGLRWEWSGVKFLAVGGAFSIDRSYRRVGSSFWFEETITEDDVEAAINGGEGVDVIVSHDVPSGLDMAAIFAIRGFNYSLSPESEKNRSMLRRVVQAVKPRHVFHGHYHVRYNDTLVLDEGWGVEVHGLACDEMGSDSWTICDLVDGGLAGQ